MRVEYAGPDRAGRLAELHIAAFDDPWSEKDIADLLRSPGVVGFEADGGFILVRMLAEEAEILALAVAPEARRRGVGRALARAAVSAAIAAGAKALFLEVADDNAAALALYEAEGFARVGVRRGYYARPKGGRDALVLRRALNSPGP